MDSTILLSLLVLVLMLLLMLLCSCANSVFLVLLLLLLLLIFEPVFGNLLRPLLARSFPTSLAQVESARSRFAWHSAWLAWLGAFWQGLPGLVPSGLALGS